MRRELFILTMMLLLAALVGIQSAQRRDPPPSREQVVQARTRAVRGSKPVRVPGAEKLFYGYYFSSPDANLTVSPGPTGRVVCVYGKGNLQGRASLPLAWHERVLTSLADSGIENREYSFTADGKCTLDVTYQGRRGKCGRAPPPRYPAASNAEAAAAGLLRAEVTALLASSAGEIQPKRWDGVVDDAALWYQYYEGVPPFIAALRMGGLGDCDMFAKDYEARATRAFRKIDQEFLARYRTQ